MLLAEAVGHVHAIAGWIFTALIFSEEGVGRRVGMEVAEGNIESGECAQGQL